tara:strand:+ start:2356 stop:2598 length:243 start_codon:yes stop_codon:yes gene_type:complete
MNRATKNDYPLDWVIIQYDPMNITDAERLDCIELDSAIAEANEHADRLHHEGSIIIAAVIGASLGLVAGYLLAVYMGAAQ